MARGKRLAAMPPQAPLHHAELSSIGAWRGEDKPALAFFAYFRYDGQERGALR